MRLPLAEHIQRKDWIDQNFYSNFEQTPNTGTLWSNWNIEHKSRETQVNSVWDSGTSDKFPMKLLARNKTRIGNARMKMKWWYKTIWSQHNNKALPQRRIKRLWISCFRLFEPVVILLCWSEGLVNTTWLHLGITGVDVLLWQWNLIRTFYRVRGQIREYRRSGGANIGDQEVGKPADQELWSTEV